MGENQACSASECAAKVEEFYFLGSQKRCVCASHIPLFTVTFPIAALELVTVSDAHSLEDVRTAELMERLAASLSKSSPTSAVKCYTTANRIRSLFNSIDPVAISNNIAMGTITRRSGNFNHALAYFQEAREMQKNNGATKYEIFTTYYEELKTLASAHDMDTSLKLFAKLTKMFDAYPEDITTVKCYYITARLMTEHGEFEDALPLSEAALRRIAGESLLKAKVLVQVGCLLQLTGAYRESAAALSRALAIFQRNATHSIKILQLYCNLASAYRYLGDDVTAKKVYLEGLNYSSPDPNCYWFAEIYNSLGAICIDDNEHAEAVPYLQSCLRIIDITKQGTFLGFMARMNLAMCYEKQKQWADAESVYQPLLKYLEQFPEVPLIAQIRGSLAMIYRSLSRRDDARHSFEQALQALDSSKYPAFSAWLHYSYGHLLRNKAPHFIEALRLWKAAGVPEAIPHASDVFVYPKEMLKIGTVIKRGVMMGRNCQAEAHERLGYIYCSKRLKKLAKKHLRAALRIFQQQGRAGKVLSTIWKLKKLERLRRR